MELEDLILIKMSEDKDTYQILLFSGIQSNKTREVMKGGGNLRTKL